MGEAAHAAQRSAELGCDPAFPALVRILVEDEGDAEALSAGPRVIMEFRLLRRVVLAARPPRAITVHDDGSHFTLPDGTAVDLRRRGASTRRLLAGLATASAEGRRLSVAEAFEVGWPGERIRWESARQRVYVTIATLRQVGLDDLLDSNDEGYLLRVPVRLAAPTHGGSSAG